MYVSTQCIIVLYIQTTSTWHTHTHRLTDSLRFCNRDDQAKEGPAEGTNVFATEDGAKQAKQQSICKGKCLFGPCFEDKSKEVVQRVIDLKMNMQYIQSISE